MVRLFLRIALLLPAAASVAVAQPANPDLAQAAAMYRSAEAAMAEGRSDDAARDYGAAYEISKDAVLFFKIGSALDKAGKCAVAATYYRRYLREGKPSADFQRLTRDRIAACEAADHSDVPKSGVDGDGSSSNSSLGNRPAASPPIESDIGQHDGNAPAEAPVTVETGPAIEPGSERNVPTDADAATAAESFPPPSSRRTAAWIAVGAGIAFATTGAVFALSAESTEDDIADLYLVRPGGEPLPFDAATQKRYQDLVDRGDRYQLLAWASFGVAGAAALASTYFFVTSNKAEAPAKTLTLRPLVSPGSAGVRASWTW
jgi:hypothetical protein